MNLQLVIVLFCVAVALVFMLKKFRRAFVRRNNACADCGKASEFGNTAKLKELKPR